MASTTNVNLPEASFKHSMDKKAMPETDETSAPMRKSQSAGYACPTPDDSKRSNMQAHDGDLEKAGLASNIRETAAREDKDQTLIDWDGPDDPQKPVNWPAKEKWTNIILLSALTLLTWVAPTLSASSLLSYLLTQPFRFVHVRASCTRSHAGVQLYQR
jgi:hypothetical protein